MKPAVKISRSADLFQVFSGLPIRLLLRCATVVLVGNYSFSPYVHATILNYR